MNKEQLSDRASRFRGVFDIVNVPLSGSNLIEASAGTGKTYAIAGLYVRFLLEAKFSVRDILVVTYTVAATNELIERIRHILKEALRAFKNNNSEDNFLSQLLTKFPGAESRFTAVESLTRALNEFDEAAIHTIHGFCRRVLTDNAFESGELFSTELITDDQEIKLEIIEDFWRNHFYDASPEFVSYALNENLDPESLLKFSNENRFAGEIKIVPESEPFSRDRQDKLVSELRESLTRLRNIWVAFRGEAPGILSDRSLNKKIYGEKITNIIEEMDVYLAYESPSLFPGPFFEKFSASFIKVKTRSGFAPPAHPFFELCDRILGLSGELKNHFELRLVSLRKELIVTLSRELPERKQSQNVQYFDDLLLRLRGGLAKRGSEKLISSIRRRYKAALIDEFQDTDPIQYAIVSKIFQTPENVLFLIGDPKQAIYSFRGADIFAYLSAAKEADCIYTLNENWRSDPVLIDAFNALFSQRDNPFVFPEINYRKASPGNKSFPGKLTLDGHFEEPMRCWLIAPEEKKHITRESARKAIANATAAETARLVFLGQSGGAKIGDKALQPSDIAIIVRTNREALICKNSLSRLKIPAVLHSIENLFASPEALEMERFLWAVYLPDRDDLMLAALATDMIGKDLSFLYLLRQEEGIWEEWREKFLKYHELWEKKGLLAMFRFFLDREEIRERLLSLIDGERRLTNLLHLGELLQREAEERNIAMGAVIKWLVERIDHPTNNEEHQQRLETDSEAVKIVTIHKSKGLQYPVVFCPFLWGGFKKPEVPFLYHDENFAKIVDFGSSEYETHRRQAAKEALAEEIRLFYVALTRAKSSCTFVWGAINKSGTSAPAYLFHSEREGEDIFATEASYDKLSAGDVYARMKEIAEKAEGSIKVLKMPEEDETSAAPAQLHDKPVVCREFKGSIDKSWRVASFSYLVGGETPNPEYPDRDAGKDIYPVTPDLEGGKDGKNDPILSFPAGTRSGVLLHEILEKTDFTIIDDSSWLEMVGLKLRENGFDPGLQDAVSAMIKRVVDHPLVRRDGINHGFTGIKERQNDKKKSVKGEQKIFLHEIPRGSRLNEIEFYFPLKMISSERLRELFTESGVYKGNHWPDSLAENRRLHFDPVRGFMKGFIDMVFRWKGLWFLVDWKSNFLGMDKESYHRDLLPDAMDAHHYKLQYTIYLLALHSYLRLRQPGYDYRRHFGGVFYLFLRGMNPAWGEDYGVFFDRPDPERIEFLCKQIMETPNKK